METQIPTSYQQTRPKTGRSQPETDGSEGTVQVGIVSHERQLTQPQGNLLILWWREKWISLLVFILILCGALTNAFLTPSVYQAETILLVDIEQNHGNEQVLNIGRIQSLNPGSRTLANQVLLIKQSAAIAERVSSRLLQAAVATGASLTVLIPPPSLDRQVEDVSNRLRKHYLRVDLVKEREVDAIQISVQSRVPEEAALIANLFAEEYVEYSREGRRSHIEASRLFLEQQISKTTQVLQDYERQIEHFKTQDSATEFSPEEYRTRIAHLESLLDDAKIEMLTQQAKIQSLEDELNQVRPNLTIRVASGVEHEIEKAQMRIAELELLLEQARARNALSSTDYVRSEELVRARAEITHLKDIVLGLSGQYVDEMLNASGVDIGIPGPGTGWTYVSQLRKQIAETKIAISGLQARIDALTRRSSEYHERIKLLPSHEIQLARLQREQRLTEENYLSLTEKLQEIRMAGEARIGLGEIIKPATIPEQPVSPRKARILGMGFLLAAVISLGVASLLVRLDNRIHAPEDVYAFGDKPVTVVPDIQKSFPKRNDQQGSDQKKGSHCQAAIEDAYKRLFFDIISCSDEGKRPTVLVTSTETGAGKSTTVINLAMTAGEEHLRTLILDIDLYKPDLSKWLNNRSRLSLKEILQSPFPTFLDSDFETGIPFIYSITSPEPCREAARLIGSRALSVLLKDLETHFDLILIDAPPALAVGEVNYLAARCDLTIVVAQAGSTRADAFRLTLAELRAAGVDRLKTVLNRFDPSHEYGYRDTLGYRFRDYYLHQNFPECQTAV